MRNFGFPLDYLSFLIYNKYVIKEGPRAEQAAGHGDRTMSKNWYAVQVGSNYASDNGSTVKREALRMARQEAKKPENDGLEVRIAVCTTDDDYCQDEIIVREGTRA